MYILKVFAQVGRVFDGLSASMTDSFEAGVTCLCTIFDEWNASSVAMVWVVIVNLMWAACMWGIMCALRLRIEQDLRESRNRGHESRGERPQRLSLIEGLLNLSGCSLVDRTLSLFGYKSSIHASMRILFDNGHTCIHKLKKNLVAPFNSTIGPC